MSDAQAIISKARWKLGISNPFFGALAMGCEVIEDDSIPTMCTDGKRIRFSPAFVEKYSFDEVVGVIAHEVMHIAFKHMLRKGDFNHKLWNMATDYAINLIVVDAGLKIPECGLLDRQYEGMSAEEIYHKLLDDAESQTGEGGQGGIGIPQDGDGEGSDGDGDENGEGQSDPWDFGGFEEPTKGDGTPLSEADQKALESDISVRVLEAHTSAQKAGRVPAGIDGLVTKLLEPKVDWVEHLRRFVGGQRPDDFSMRRPHRQMLGSFGMFLPSVERFGAGNIVVINDSSGSCVRDAPKFFTEINAVSEDYSPDSITVITFDTVVQDVAEYTAGETIEGLSTKGGGGTNIVPAFDYIEEHGINPDAVIVFTDLYLWEWPEEPDYPVLWITTGRTDAPFGEVASMH